MPENEAKTHTPEQMAFATGLAQRIEKLPNSQRPTMRALLSAFVTGAEAMCSESLSTSNPDSDEKGVSK